MKNINIYALYAEGQVFVNMEYENAFVKCVMGVLIVNIINYTTQNYRPKTNPLLPYQQ